LVALVRYRSEYDAVLVCGFRILGIPAVLAARSLGKRCVLKADSLGEMSGDYFSAGLGKLGWTTDSFPFSLFLTARNRLFLGADRFVAISGAILREFLEAGVESDLIHTIPNSVDTERFRPVADVEKSGIRRSLGLPEDRKVTAYTGRLVSYKGLPLLLRVWADLAGEGDPGLLLLVGAGGSDMHNCEEELREFVREQRLESYVVFTGEVDEVEVYLQAADLFVFPSENEAFGISVIEAMASGLPVACSDAGGLPEIVEDGLTGLSFPSGNGKRLKEILLQLLSDGELRRSLGEAARISAMHRYSEDRVVGLYAELLGAQVTGPPIH
jgi:glycosyltransferase involved in cell wall biosynthesis